MKCCIEKSVIVVDKSTENTKQSRKAVVIGTVCEQLVTNVTELALLLEKIEKITSVCTYHGFFALDCAKS